MRAVAVLCLLLLSMSVTADSIGLSWTHANSRVDGSVLLQSDITDYIIKYSVDGGVPVELSVGNGESAEIVAQAGTYIFSIATVTTERGPFSEPVVVVVEDIPIAKPAPPALSLLILCDTSGCTLQVRQ